MDNSQYTPRTLVPSVNQILMDNIKQSLDITHEYNNTNPELTNKNGKIIKDNNGQVFNINSQGVTTYYPTSDVYDETSGKRGVPGSGIYSIDKSSIPILPYVVNPNVIGFDENSKLYLNGNIRSGQSQGDEKNNIFAGVKTPGSFQYKSCNAIPLNNDYQLGGSSRELIITDASYGSNCGNASGNRTQLVQDYISQNPDKTTYNIGWGVMDLGDPFVGCNKEMSITYKCNGSTNTIKRTDGKFDSGSSLDLTCASQAEPYSLTKCYYDALAKGLSYFGLGNVDSNTNMGTCYAGGSDILNNEWQNPGIPIWKIDIRKDFGYKGNSITNFFVCRNNNAYFSENGIHAEGNYTLYDLCKAGKLINADPANAQAFASEWNDDTRAMFLANGNLYFFSFPVSMTLPSDLRENPQNYGQYMIYSSGTEGETLNIGWTDMDITSGVDDNMLLATPHILGSLTLGQSIYSADGKLKLTFNPDYTLVLYTGDPNAVGCKTDMSNNSVGYDGIAVNQINDMNTDGEKYFGKLAYVNRAGTAYEYTDSSLFHYSDKYTSNPGYSINNIDSNKNATKYITPYGSIGIAYDGSPDSIENCQTQCSKSGACVGTVIDNGNCYLLDAIKNEDVVYKDSNVNIGQRQPIMNLRIPGINKKGEPSYSVYPNYTMPGADLGPSTTTKSANECLDICNKTEGCHSIEFDRGGNGEYGYCYPKSYKEPTSMTLVNNSDVYIRNPEIIENPMETTYTKYAHSTRAGYDIGENIGPTPQVSDCMKGCNEREDCGGFEYWDWVGYCWLKNREGVKWITEADGGDAMWVKNPASSGTSYLIPTNVNVVDPNKFANYNISSSPMSNLTHDISLMPESITNNFLQTSSQLKERNDKIVRETDRIIRESFTSTQIYESNDKNLSKLDYTLNGYMEENPKLSTNIVTLNKMVSNSSIQMTYMNITYSILLIFCCIILVVAFTISL